MNPFDQFAVNLNDALPPQQPTAGDGNSLGLASQQQQQQQPQQFNLMAPPAPERKPIMSVPGMMMPPQQQQQQPMMMYGQQQQQPPPPSHSGMMYRGQPPTQQPPSQGMFGGPPPPPQWPSGGSFGGTNGQSSSAMMSMSMAGALVPSGMQSNPYALGPADNPFGPPSFPPQQQQIMQQPPPPQQQQQNQQPPMPFQQQQQQAQPQVAMQRVADPFGFDSSPMRPQPQQQQAQQQPQFGTTSIVPLDPFGMAPPSVPQQPQQQQLTIDPWGGGFEGIQQQQQQPSTALVPASMPSDDPFGIFGGGGGGGGFSGGTPAPLLPSSNIGGGAPQPVMPANDDPWADMGFGPSSVPPLAPVPGVDDDLFNATLQPTREDESNPPPTSSTPSSPRKDSSKRKKGELPPGGEWYDAKIFTPTLGVMFFKPKELVDSLFLQTDKKLVDALDERPVVAFIVEGSSARSAGVELGHVLLKVNGIDVKNPKEASRLIKEGPRPLPLLFYVPETSVVVAEGEHMVKYNTKDTTAPNSAKDWKPKYVVVGGIIAQPWIMNMYRSKSEYDIAVIETQARRPISVKVKQFSLQGARIQNDWQGPQMVKYKNKLHPWKYIVVLPVARNPIKIGAPNLSQLKPVHEGIRRVLQAQQERAGGHVVAGPVIGPSDPYRSGSGGGGYDGREQNGHDNHRDRAGHGY